MTREEALLVVYDEVNYLYTRGLLSQHLGRTESIFEECKRVFDEGIEVESKYDHLAKSLRVKYGYTNTR
jgi:hypothetical protein